MTPEVIERIEQIRHGNVPDGYKRTGVGSIPINWTLDTLASVMGNLEAGTSVNSDPANDSGYYILKTSAVSHGTVNLQESKSVLAADIPRLKCPVKKGCIMVSRMNTPALVGECGYIKEASDIHFLPDRLWQSANNSPDTCDFVWLNQLLNYKRYKAAIQATATGTSNSMKNISKESFLGLTVAFPLLKEQQKIAEILTTQDKVIELKETRLAEKQRQKKHLMQQLLTGKKRLPGFDGEWKKIAIGSFICEVDEKTTENNQYDILSVTKNGIVRQSDHFNKQIASEDNTGYKILRCGNLAFSSMNLWMGSLDVLEDYEIGIISPAYKVFSFNTRLMDIKFGRQFMRSEPMIWQYKVNSEQGASIVRRNLDLKALLSTKVSIPGMKEQQAIASVFVTADREINLLRQDLEQEKQKKKVLMQLLLTGIVRVNA